MAKAIITQDEHRVLVGIVHVSVSLRWDRTLLYVTLDHMVNGHPKHELPTAVDSPSRSPYAIDAMTFGGTSFATHRADDYTHAGFELGAL